MTFDARGETVQLLSVIDVGNYKLKAFVHAEFFCKFTPKSPMQLCELVSGGFLKEQTFISKINPRGT